VEAAFALDLALETVEEVAFEFRNLPASQARHMNVVPLRTPFIEVFLTLHVHKVEFVNQAVALEQVQSAIDRDAINAGIEATGLAKDLRRIEVLLGSLYHAENGTALVRHAEAARHKFSLQASGNFGLRQRHGDRTFLRVETQLQ
jgi:hypothetical protein